MTEKTPSSVWVVTKEVNAYDQFGDYLIGVFIEKPTVTQLQSLLPELRTDAATHLERGGGRIKTEDEWYYLTRLEVGKNYNAPIHCDWR